VRPTAAQHSQQERARAQVKAEEASAAWRNAFAADESQQQQTSGDQAGASSSAEPSLLNLQLDLDDPLQVRVRIRLRAWPLDSQDTVNI